MGLLYGAPNPFYRKEVTIRKEGNLKDLIGQRVIVSQTGIEVERKEVTQVPEQPTKEKLLELGKKAYERQERDRKLTKAHYIATKKLISANQEQFNTYLDEAKRELGL